MLIESVKKEAKNQKNLISDLLPSTCMHLILKLCLDTVASHMPYEHTIRVRIPSGHDKVG
jgi:hypothetical protein